MKQIQLNQVSKRFGDIDSYSRLLILKLKKANLLSLLAHLGVVNPLFCG
jgi:hypothetical protein